MVRNRVYRRDYKIHDIDEKNRFHHVRESEKASLDDRYSVNKKNHVGSWTEKLTWATQ